MSGISTSLKGLLEERTRLESVEQKKELSCQPTEDQPSTSDFAVKSESSVANTIDDENECSPSKKIKFDEELDSFKLELKEESVTIPMELHKESSTSQQSFNEPPPLHEMKSSLKSEESVQIFNNNQLVQPLTVDTKVLFPTGYIVAQTSAENKCDVCRRVTHIEDDSEQIIETQIGSSPSPKTEKDRIFKWIQCDGCNIWLHLKCAGLEEWECDIYDKFYCVTCHPEKGPNILHPKLATHRYRYYSKEEIGQLQQMGTQAWCEDFAKTEETRFGTPTEHEVVICETGYDFMEHFEANRNWSKVYLVKNRAGLCMCMPDPGTFDLENIVDIVGADFNVDTIDVYRQDTYSMKLGTFLKKMRDPERPRYKLYNILSLEFSDNAAMRERVTPPCIVGEISFVHRLWPEPGVPYQSHMHVLEEHIPMKPKVAEFCLAGMGGSYTDFHIDFGGSSVWYHIYKGQKIFYILEPTKEHLKAYEVYHTEQPTTRSFLDHVPADHIKRVVIKEGETLMVPSGWIHAVYTPMDSLVFGGNFLHMANVPMQLQIYALENRIRSRAPADEKFFFPNFEFVNWYAVSHLLLDTLKEYNDEENLADDITWNAVEAFAPELQKWLDREEKQKTDVNEATSGKSYYADILSIFLKRKRHQEKIRKAAGKRRGSSGKKKRKKSATNDDDDFRPSHQKKDGIEKARSTRSSPEPLCSGLGDDTKTLETPNLVIRLTEPHPEPQPEPLSMEKPILKMKFEPAESETSAQIFSQRRSSSGRKIQVTSLMRNLAGSSIDTFLEDSFDDGAENNVISFAEADRQLEEVEKKKSSISKPKAGKPVIIVPKQAPKVTKKPAATVKQRLSKKLKLL